MNRTDRSALFGVGERSSEEAGVVAARVLSELCPADRLADRGDRLTVRFQGENGERYVAKYWRLASLRARLRRAAGKSKGRCEWLVSSYLSASGVPTPRPIAYCALSPTVTGFDECVFWEYIPAAENAGLAVHRSCKMEGCSQWVHIARLAIALTEQCLAFRLYDNDHRLSNMIVKPDGSVLRIDFENAAVLRSAPGARRLASMLGGTVATFAFVAQYRAGAAERFAGALLSRCRLAAGVRRRVLEVAVREMHARRARSGVATVFDAAAAERFALASDALSEHPSS